MGHSGQTFWIVGFATAVALFAACGAPSTPPTESKVQWYSKFFAQHEMITSEARRITIAKLRENSMGSTWLELLDRNYMSRGSMLTDFPFDRKEDEADPISFIQSVGLVGIGEIESPRAYDRAIELQRLHSLARTPDATSNVNDVRNIIYRLNETIAGSRDNLRASWIGFTMHIIEDSFAPSHSLRNDRPDGGSQIIQLCTYGFSLPGVCRHPELLDDIMTGGDDANHNQALCSRAITASVEYLLALRSLERDQEPPREVMEAFFTKWFSVETSDLPATHPIRPSAARLRRR
jgi:hypothetical protein